jgi:hypothetical protein
MSISVSAQSLPQRNEPAWLGFKVALVFVAVIIFSLAVTTVEVRTGLVPSDNVIAWEYGGE